MNSVIVGMPAIKVRKQGWSPSPVDILVGLIPVSILYKDTSSVQTELNVLWYICIS